MNHLAHCPYCSHLVSGEPVTLWDGRTYCRKCIDEVSPELYDFASSRSRLEETVTLQDVSAFRYVSYIGKGYFVFVSLIFGLPTVLLVLTGKADIWAPVFVFAVFGGVGIVLFLLASVTGIVALRSNLPRTIFVKDGEFRIVTPKEDKIVKLKNCKWYYGTTAADQLCWFTGLRRGVVIQTPERKIACGHTHEVLNHWRNFLLLTRIPQNPPRGWLQLIVIAGVGMIVGAVVGSAIGYIVSILTNNTLWTPWLGFMGAFEGAVVALCYATCTSDGAEAARNRMHPASVGLVFFVIGMKFGGMGGLPGALVCGAINALFGGFVAWFCRTKIQAVEMERELDI